MFTQVLGDTTWSLVLVKSPSHLSDPDVQGLVSEAMLSMPVLHKGAKAVAHLFAEEPSS